MTTMCDQAAIRGKFYQPIHGLQAPVHLDGRVFQYLSDKAVHKGMSLEDLVNDLLKKTIELSWKLES